MSVVCCTLLGAPDICFTDFSVADLSLLLKVIIILYILECYVKRIVELDIYCGISDMQSGTTLIGNVSCEGLMMLILSTGHTSAANLNPSLMISFSALHHDMTKIVASYPD